MNSTPDPTLAPFSCSYTPQVPELLHRLGCTIVVSTYQAGKLLLLSSPDGERLVQLPRTFPKPMGIAGHSSGDKLALAVKDGVIVFRNSRDLAMHYPKAPSTYDAMYLPRTTYHTGPLDVHDLCFGNGEELFAVNTLFSCIASINSEYNFTPWWTPPFIDKLASEDRCHLNGMAMKDGVPEFASMFGEGNSMRSWTSTLIDSGVIYHIPSNEPIVGRLAMPHSPRLFHDGLFVLLSGTGELIRVDTNSGRTESIASLNGFVRGMARIGDHLFIGLSKIRKNSSSFGKLKIAEQANQAGVVILHVPSGSVVGKIIYTASVDEIYDVHILEGTQRPNILNTLTNTHNMALMTPETTYWGREMPKQP